MIFSNTPYITVQSDRPPYFYATSGNLGAGQIRYNPSTSNLEVYDGQTWQIFSINSNIDLAENTKKILAWAETKMREEEQLVSLMQQHPGLKDLHDQFNTMLALVRDHG